MTENESQRTDTDSLARAHMRVWELAFLTQLAKNGNVAAACRESGVGRSTAYQAREADAMFKAAWDIALEDACDALEEEAWRRAHDGIDKPVFWQGKEIGKIREYSDSLMIQLLKAHRPEKYRDRTEIMGKDGGPIQTEEVLSDEERARRIAAILDAARARRDGQTPEAEDKAVGGPAGAAADGASESGG